MKSNKLTHGSVLYVAKARSFISNHLGNHGGHFDTPQADLLVKTAVLGLNLALILTNGYLSVL